MKLFRRKKYVEVSEYVRWCTTHHGIFDECYEDVLHCDMVDTQGFCNPVKLFIIEE